MPGLSQLKQFNKDLLSLGDEITVRASRGEKPVQVIIPKEVEDVNDSEDFVLGMPQIEAEIEAAPVDEDLSDLAGLANPSASTGSSEPAPTFEAPDLSSLLNPINVPDDASAGMDMPDLSMFEEQEEPEEEIVEEEPEEISIADMGLDALLSGGGFDAPEEETTEEPEPESTPLDLDDFKDVEDLDSFDTDLDEIAPMEELPQDDGLSEIERDLLAAGTELSDTSPSNNEEPSLDDLLGNLDIDTPAEEEPVAESGDADLDAILGNETIEEDLPEVEPVDNLEDIGGLDDLVDFEDEPAAVDTPVEDIPLEEPLAETEDVLPELGTDEFELEDIGAEDISAENISGEDFSTDDFSTDVLTDAIPEEEDAGTSDLGDFDLSGLDDFGTADLSPEQVEVDSEIPAMPEELLSDESPLEDFSADTANKSESEALSTEDFGLGDFDTTGLDEPVAETTDVADAFSLDDMDFGAPAETVDFDEGDEIPDYGEDTSESDGDDEEQTPEVFDTSEMDGMDFGIPDTDAQLNGDFELGGADDFAMEGEFEIPGFSDVQTAKEEKVSSGIVSSKDKKGKGKNIDEADFSDAEESEDLPPNTLSDVQYKQFLKNLSEYPLNVRLAFEDLIVQDEFTDDAEFEVIEKILNKAPARQVASMLEKMLDISIPVPRDFEHRTAEEYEAYKKSLSYQLRNKIIPGILVGIVALLVMWGIFNFTKNCIYKPLKASKLYKQGYALLEADEYPQSEMKFEEAVTYRINKKWFFNYARGYRKHRQYQRAGSMYERILKYYKHDKAAGLEYADMELNDLANYKRAEEIVRREILDYHINDADGILKLGDIFLEWGTEKEPAMLESAREQYATLMQLYGATDLYLSRMMRYFIRSDNLRNVIQMKNTFDNKPKALGAEDLTELSGYLLDKYYGPLAPSDEYLRYEIEGLRGLLLNAVKANPDNPISLYNLSKYFIQSGELAGIEPTLQNAIEKFNTIQSMKKRDIYKYIDSYRLLGEHYIDTTDYLKAQEQFAEGISLYTTERDNAGFEGTPEIGKLYADMGNIKYSISGDYDEALMNYKYSVELENDTPSIRYRIGYIQYKNKNYVEALGSFMKAGDGNVKQRNLLLAMANTLSLRGDDYAAQGYYNQLIDNLDAEIAKRGVVFPQASVKDYDVVNTYLSAANNYGVTLYKLAKRTGNSGLNAQAIVQFQQSLRAWDAMTRNQETMVRLGGSNLAEQNIQYITHSVPEFEPAIYTEIAKTLLDNEHL